MKVTLQESLNRAGISADQYPHAEDDGNPKDIEMGGPQAFAGITDQPTYFNPYVASLFDLDADQEFDEDELTAVEDTFMREIGGIENLAQMLPPGSNITHMQEEGNPFGTTQLPTSSAQAQSTFPTVNTQALHGLSSQPVLENPKIQIRLRQVQNTSPQMVPIKNERLPTSQPTSENVHRTPGYGATAAGVTYPLPHTTPADQTPILAPATYYSPAPSPTAESTAGSSSYQMGYLSDSSLPSPTPANQSSAKYTSSSSANVSVVTKSEQILSPDTSSQDDVNQRPVKSRPIDMDSVMDRNKKNAIQARLNRQKKKAYVETLEEDVDNLNKSNESLKQENHRLTTENHRLVEEVAYLKNVLQNDSSLAGLLKDLGHSQNLRLSSSFFGQKRSSSEAKLENERPRKLGSGVCLHVDKGDVSVELCTQCSLMANGTNPFTLKDKQTEHS